MNKTRFIGSIIVILVVVGAGLGGYYYYRSKNANSGQKFPLADGQNPNMLLPINTTTTLKGLTVFFNTSSSHPHGGFDFCFNGTTMINSPVNAVVWEIKKYKHESNGNWQINMFFILNRNWSLELYFEPWAYNETAIDTILATIQIHVNDTIKAGDLIGTITPLGEDCRCHISLVYNGAFVCPYPYFTAEAKTQFDAMFASFPTGYMDIENVTQPCN